MLFSSMTFLWVFLPIVLVCYYLSRDVYRNYILLIASLIFYAWGEPVYVFLMLFSILINYLSGLAIHKTSGFKRKAVLAGCVAVNMGLLGYFKYFNLFADTINRLFDHQVIVMKDIALPIGISFFTFQALSYVVDLYRGEIQVQKSPFSLALYVTLFPQLIAGPIVRYATVEKEISDRSVNAEKFALGVRRFIIGLSKKVILANAMAEAADTIFGLEYANISQGVAWMGAIFYTLQIYYDFSGYSDMAIGLGHMFGFTFLENFNLPYIASSIQDFWRRWHISLSTWFKEYLYIPLGGNRKGRIRTYINLLIVFFATGLWHGASYNFVAWGLFHGLFLIIERMFLGKWLSKNKLKIFNHLYVMLVVIVGWVMFRIESLRLALTYLKVMFLGGSTPVYSLVELTGVRVLILLIPAILLCGFIQEAQKAITSRLSKKSLPYERTAKVIGWVSIPVYTVLLIACMTLLACNTYNPFIYFRF